ncbi:MAG: WD40 repeat domain-containing protein, partial [Pyrinomonadaceae bacterium]
MKKTAQTQPTALAAVIAPRFTFLIVLIAAVSTGVLAQVPSATPTPASQEKRGIGVQTSGSANNAQSDQAAREAKPELVLQSGYSGIFGATRLAFSPDGRLLATTSFRSSSVKLWETSTGRELRNLSSGTHSGMGMSPFIAFSRDSRRIAAAAGDNSVKIWDVVSGRELQTLSGAQGSMTSAISGIAFIGFTPDGRVVTVSDAIRVWDAASGHELRSISMEMNLNTSAFMGGGAGAAITPDGNQLAFVVSDGGEKHEVKFWDLATGREARAVNLPNKEIDSIELAFTSDGRLL